MRDFSQPPYSFGELEVATRELLARHGLEAQKGATAGIIAANLNAVAQKMGISINLRMPYNASDIGKVLQQLVNA